jgi:hypothetical protein
MIIKSGELFFSNIPIKLMEIYLNKLEIRSILTKFSILLGDQSHESNIIRIDQLNFNNE